MLEAWRDLSNSIQVVPIEIPAGAEA